MRSVNKTTRPPIRHHRRLTGGDHNVVGPVGADSEVGAWLRPPEPSVRASAESRRDPDGRLFRRSTLPGANWTEPPGIDRFGAAQAAAKPRRGGGGDGAGGGRGRGRPAAAGATSWVLVAVSPCRPRAALAQYSFDWSSAFVRSLFSTTTTLRALHYQRQSYQRPTLTRLTTTV